MKLSYVRKSTRDTSDRALVEVLVALGFETHLSTDAEDELLGIDAWTQYQGKSIPIDFFCGFERSEYLPSTIAKAESRGVVLLHIPKDLFNSILCKDLAQRRQALLQIKEITQKGLCYARFNRVTTTEEAQAQVAFETKTLYYSRSSRVVAA